MIDVIERANLSEKLSKTILDQVQSKLGRYRTTRQPKPLELVSGDEGGEEDQSDSE